MTGFGLTMREVRPWRFASHGRVPDPSSPGLRTSPVKRGYWVVRRVLGEVIPPPPPVVPELPQDEAKSDAPLRDVLAQHRSNPVCAGCHARFDTFGLAMEGYGPVGETRSKDLAGRLLTFRPRSLADTRARDCAAYRRTSKRSGRTITSTTSAASCCPMP